MSHLRFHAPHAHLQAPFGATAFGQVAEAFARFFGTPQFLIGQTIVVTAWIIANGSASVGFDPCRRRGFLNFWDQHPAIPKRHELTVGERAADDMRNLMGSWTFVFSALAFLGVWMYINREPGTVDPPPFILLNLVLSCVAALQGAILLIAAKRADQISSMLAQHDYETNVTALKKIESLEQQLLKVSEQNQQILKRLEAH